MKQFFNKHPTFKKIFLICLTFVVMTSFMVIPSFAEDLDENVTNLKGTSWILYSYITLPANGKFDVMGKFSIYNGVGNAAPWAFDGIYMGFSDLPFVLDPDDPESGNYVSNPYAPATDNLWIHAPGLNEYNGFNIREPYVTMFTFTGGSDCTNSRLIAFLRTNGERIVGIPSPGPDPSPSDNTVSAGWYYSPINAPIIPAPMEFDLPFTTASGSHTHISITESGTILFNNAYVGNANQWMNYGYRLIFVTEDTVLDPDHYSWFISVYNSVITDDGSSYRDGYQNGKQDGYLDGYQDGLAEGEQIGYEVGFDEGYRVGYEVGFADNTGGGGGSSEDSANLGKNLLGDTLSAPLKALNSLTLYKSESGFEVTLGGVFGASICLTLFLGFLKMFAGG